MPASVRSEPQRRSRSGSDQTEAHLSLIPGLEEEGYFTRAGIHCAPWAHEALPGAEDGGVRVSPGPFNSEAEIEGLAAAIHEILG